LPSTLGANRKSQDFFERVPARDPHVKALFSEDVVNKIENDIGCKIKIEEKFIIVSGKDRLILKKGVDAVHKIKEGGENKGVNKFSDEGEHKGSVGSPISQSRSFERKSPLTSRLDDQIPKGSSKLNGCAVLLAGASNLSNVACFSSFFLQQEDLEWKCLTKSSFGEAYGSDGGRGRSSHSKSPAPSSYAGNSYNSYEGHTQNRGGVRTDGWNAERGVSNMQSGRNFDFPSFPQTLEELELQYKREAMELARIRDREEDEENGKHREGVHASMWEEFLQLEGQRRQQARQHISASGFGSYKQPSYTEFDSSSGNFHHSGASIHSRGRYPNAMDSYPSSRPHDYDDFQRHRRDDFGKPYNRY
ncbi:UNVERIFIED_CONTAM: hypothetical protein Sradi_4941100, partial [Sesamum radiatum]